MELDHNNTQKHCKHHLSIKLCDVIGHMTIPPDIADILREVNKQ